jgi:hypothetical protein
MMWFWCFQSPKVYLNHNIFIFGFQCVAINIEGWFTILVYNKFWLNIPRDDCQYFTPLMNECHLGNILKILKISLIIALNLNHI